MPGPVPSCPALQPVAEAQRIEALDVIRALALFGVLLMNLPGLSGSSVTTLLGHGVPRTGLDRTVVELTEVLVHAKALSCFSLLFGIGLCIQFERASARGVPPRRFAFRRLGALFLIGAAHFTLVWTGDILVDYALVGFSLLLFREPRPRMVLVTALACFLFADLIPVFVKALHLDPRLSVWTWSDQVTRQADAVFGHGTWTEALRWRLCLWEPWYQVSRRLDALTWILPLFLAGAALWRSGAIRDPEAHGRLLRRLFHGTFWAGLLLCFAGQDPLRWLPEPWKQAQLGAPWLLLGDVGSVALALGYFTGLLRLLSRPRWRRRLRILAPMGRMALSHYLLQSLVLTWVFYAHGWGLWGRIGPARLALLATGFYALQLAASHAWLARCRFGPAEWLWRSLTYGAWQVFRR